MKIDCAHDSLVDVDKLLLIQNPKNNNKHSKEQIERLAKIIDFQGQRHPIVVSNRSGFITKGHGRLMAIHKLGWKQAAVDYQDYISEAQEYADMTADNEIARWAEFDSEKFLNDIKDIDLGDIELLGLKEIPELLTEKEGLTDPNDVPEVEQNIHNVKLGQIWKLGEHRLMCGDSTKKEEVEKLLSGAIPDLVHTDPPYGVEYDANWRNEAAEKGLILYGTSKNLGKVYNDENADWTEAYKNFNSNVIYVWHAEKFSSLIQKNLEDCDYQIVSQIIWAKPNFTISRGDYHWQHEPCWYAVKKGKKHNWQGARDQSTLWKINRDTEVNGHGTPKPIELNVKAIRNSTADGQCVADPFGGSGSTLIACEKTNRKCFMMELDPHYCSVIIERWQNFTGKKAELING